MHPCCVVCTLTHEPHPSLPHVRVLKTLARTRTHTHVTILSPLAGRRGRSELQSLGAVADQDEDEDEQDGEGRGRRPSRMRAARNVNRAAYAVDITDDTEEVDSPNSSSTRESSGGKRGRGRGRGGGRRASDPRALLKKKLANQTTESDSPNLSESLDVSVSFFFNINTVM